MKRVRLVVVTGLSGSGKTAALKALEDLGCMPDVACEFNFRDIKFVAFIKQ